jgi:hypothetical protein
MKNKMPKVHMMKPMMATPKKASKRKKKNS